MPQPSTPPDSDQPHPIAWTSQPQLLVFRFDQRGVKPHFEQHEYAYRLDGRHVSVMMLGQRDSGVDLFTGVGVAVGGGTPNRGEAELERRSLKSGVVTSLTFKTAAPDFKAKIYDGRFKWRDRSRRRVALEVEAAAATRSGSDTAYVVAVPLGKSQGKRSDFQCYLRQAAWCPLDRRYVRMTVECGGPRDYALFVATGVPGDMRVDSAAYRIAIR